MKPTRNTNSQAGFSILEIVITLFMIGVILALFQAAMSSVLLARNARNQETALRVASNKIEELRAAGYDSLPASGPFTDSQLSVLNGALATMTFTDFSSTTKQVLVNVQWQEPGSPVPKSLSLTTLVAKMGGLQP